MKRLLVSEIFPPRSGGSGRWFWEIYRRLSRADHVIAAGENPQQQAFDQTHDLRIERVPLSMTQWGLRSWIGLRGYSRALRRLQGLVRREGIGFIHCGRCLPEGVMVLALKLFLRVPYLVYVHGEDINTARDSRELTWLVKQVLRRADCLIANSVNTANLLLHDWQRPSSQVKVLHPGVDVERFQPAARNEQIRERLGWRGRRVVLIAGRLQRRKWQDQMIRAVSLLRERLPDLLCCLVGHGEDELYLRQLAADLQVTDRIQFRGEAADSELIECFQQCDLCALPNRQVGQDIEGFGMVLLEAQACGRPVLAGASGGTAETMRVGETGRIVPCDGPEELAEQVADLLSDPQRLDRMGAAGRAWVTEKFAWEALTVEAQSLFDELESRGPQGAQRDFVGSRP
ncbi:MAG: glycosyltransferase family 4 protein [Planctomycetota bacterium]